MKMIHLNGRRFLVAGCLFAFMMTEAHAGVLVIGHKGDSVSSLSKRQAKNFYLGKMSAFTDGTSVAVIDLPMGHATRNAFYSKVVGKSKKQLRAYWAKRIFTGKGAPPRMLDSVVEVKKWVAGGAGRLGYIDSGAADDTVSVLLQIP